MTYISEMDVLGSGGVSKLGVDRESRWRGGNIIHPGSDTPKLASE
jgi:hypothetical protein